jgi:hypothetical protein
LSYHSVTDWARAFDGAVQAYLDRHSAGSPRRALHVTASACTKHGAACVAVVYGELLAHYPWAKTDPTQLAEQLPRRDVGGILNGTAFALGLSGQVAELSNEAGYAIGCVPGKVLSVGGRQ